MTRQRMSSRTATNCVDKDCIRSSYINRGSGDTKVQNQGAKSPFNHGDPFPCHTSFSFASLVGQGGRWDGGALSSSWSLLGLMFKFKINPNQGGTKAPPSHLPPWPTKLASLSLSSRGVWQGRVLVVEIWKLQHTKLLELWIKIPPKHILQIYLEQIFIPP